MVYIISYKTPADPKPLHIRFDKIDGFIISPDGKIKHLVLFDYGLLDKMCGKIKIVLIIILERSKLIHIIHCQLKEY